MSMETKVIKPLLRSLFISYALSALFLGALAFALYKLRLGESLVNLLIFAVYFAACFAGGFFTGRKVRNRRFFWGLLSGMFYFLILFAASWAMDPRASIQAARSLMVLGVKGAALATVLSQACSAVWVVSFLFSRRASLPLEKRYMGLDRKIILSILALGVSPFIMASTESLVGFVLNSSLKEFGDIYISALTILQSSMQFASVPLTGFAQGFVPIISYNFGHGDKQRVKDCFRIALITMFSFNLILMLLMILFPSTVASAFTSDEKLIETVRWTMPVFLGGMTIFGLQRACQNMFVALGQAKISIFIALLRKAILLIPLALILPHYMGVTGVYAAEAISDATAAICCTLLFFWQFPKILGKMK